ncbi:hypothetical protein CK203_099119 [Vitis vinifera]|uniref:Reverse transcriptase domain-containing protein n=1 Tax=Vitis vinifera TaxID=29760 RepID=A0A438CWM7_VITVI|nr:hypothetical protein CK203_099119 [Vitis vinifera]
MIVSHLLFADDTLIFCDAEADQLRYLSWTFMWFEAISGLKVNLSKTEAIPVGEGIPMETLASVLGCKIGSLPTSYLGLPLGAPYKSTRVWDAVEERFRKRKEAWAFEVYLPLTRPFLGNGCGDSLMRMSPFGSKLSLVSMTFKRGMVLQRSKRPLWGGVWKAIRNGWENFRSHSRFIIGDGTRVKFWKDLWCGNQALKEAFPILFNLSVNKDGWVIEAWEEEEVGGSWGPRFNRHLNDWEVGEVESLLCKLHPLTIRRGMEDLFRWKENKNGSFSVKSFIVYFQGTPSPPSRLELFGRLGFQLGLASLGGRGLGTGYSPLTA